MNLKGRHFLKLLDFTPEEITYLLDLAEDLKLKKKQGISVADMHKGKNIALIFEKTSTRTRCSFEVAAHDLGMNTTYLEPTGSQIGKKESIADTARVLGRMYEGIEYRGYGQEIVEELAEYAGVPVWNGLTNEFHPTQMLADLLTIREHFGHLKGIKMTYMGDARYNMGNSLMVACAKMGMHFTACTTKNYFPEAALVEECKKIAATTGATITLTEDVMEGTKGADVVYTDVWVSMGEPADAWKSRIEELSPYKVDRRVMENAGEKAVFMHCLPAFHDLKTTIGRQMGEKFGFTELEVTDEVFESAQSLVFDEAENRMHTIKSGDGSYPLRKNEENMNAETILNCMTTETMGRNVVYLKKTGSTNQDAMKLAAKGAAEGTLVVADCQEAGKGRRGRVWMSPAGENIYCTLLLKPSFSPDKASMLTLVAALSVAQAIEQETGIRAGIKWPNDLVLDGKKICGILTEMSLEAGKTPSVVIGIGINVRQTEFSEEIQDKATCLAQHCKENISRSSLIARLMKCFEINYGMFKKDLSLTGLKPAYEERLVNLGKEVCVLDPAGEYRGIAREISETGELLVELADGQVRQVYAGEVSVRGIYGYV